MNLLDVAERSSSSGRGLCAAFGMILRRLNIHKPEEIYETGDDGKTEDNSEEVVRKQIEPKGRGNR